jgi:tRNA pseudouridine38-40 synthase
MRIVLVVEYNGTEYSGWQRQPGLRTVQGVLENSISIVANHPVETSCSGRTDKGVHAFQQFVHFDSDAVRDEDSWLRGINSNLPSTIKVRDVVFSNPEFHARHSSNARTYHYYIYNNKTSSALFSNNLAWFPKKLNIPAMQEACSLLVGTHDFSSFRSSECQAKSPVKTIINLNIIERPNNIIVITVTANSFLYNMVRNIVGLLLMIGDGRYKPSYAKEILELRNRNNGVKKADPHGLYFIVSHYDAYPNYLFEKYLF